MANLLTRVARGIRLRIAGPELRRANALRDHAEWIEAVIGYRRTLAWLPWREDLYVQIGNCLKEFGDYRGAIKAYALVKAEAYRPEATKQLADANRRAGYVTLPYAIAGHPNQLRSSTNGDASHVAARAADLPNRLRIETMEPRRWLGSLARIKDGGRVHRASQQPSIVLDQVGTLSLIHDGAPEPLLAGVVAIRARITAPGPVDRVELWLGAGSAAHCIHAEPARPVEEEAGKTRLHVANMWIDSALLPAGRHWLEVRAGSHVPPAGLFVHVSDPALPLADVPSADSLVPSPAVETDDLVASVAAVSAQARPAARSLFDRPIRSIVAMRVDQLGDVSASLPAIARLRTLFPDARLTALVQPGVAAVVEASGIVDEVLTLALSYDFETETRSLDLAEEARVAAQCAERRFDLAIDLSPGDEMRPLLLLTGATYLVGFNADRFTFLDYGIGVRSRDKANQRDNVSHAAVVMTLVEALGIAAALARPPVPRVAPVDAALAAHGLTPGGHVVLHTGARHAINRWPMEHFLALAEHFLRETSHHIVIFGAGPADRLPPALRGNDRAHLFDLIDGDAFDAILSAARLMIGNDSGPKHLAATRGVPTISVHVGRLNWNEWGQDGRGTILSKRVPCSGCGLNDIRLCGRDAICVRSIGVDEVLAAARPFL
jgi:ADP-heptose:LPS heptosyltransferase